MTSKMQLLLLRNAIEMMLWRFCVAIRSILYRQSPIDGALGLLREKWRNKVCSFLRTVLRRVWRIIMSLRIENSSLRSSGPSPLFSPITIG